jgi:uncharacterized protein YpuA (DUF1002 family)
MDDLNSITPPASPAASDPTADRPESHDCCSDAAIAARMAQQFAVLATLTRIGMKVADVVERAVDATIAAPMEAEPAQQAEQAERLATAYSRVARAVRVNLTTENQITRDHEKREARERAEREGRCTLSPAVRRNRLKSMVERVMDQVIDREIPPDDQDEIRDTLQDCLDDFDEDPNLTDRSVGALVASICNDLYLDPDWSWWQDERWAVKEIRDKPPGSPYADWRREPDDEPESAGHDPPDAVS